MADLLSSLLRIRLDSQSLDRHQEWIKEIVAHEKDQERLARLHEHEALLAVFDADKESIHDSDDATWVILAHMLAHLVKRVETAKLVNVEPTSKEFREQALCDPHVIISLAILSNQGLQGLLHMCLEGTLDIL